VPTCRCPTERAALIRRRAAPSLLITADLSQAVPMSRDPLFTWVFIFFPVFSQRVFSFVISFLLSFV